MGARSNGMEKAVGEGEGGQGAVARLDSAEELSFLVIRVVEREGGDVGESG